MPPDLAIWFVVRRSVCDLDIPAAMAAKEMGHGKTSSAETVTTIYKLLTEMVVMGLPQSMWWGSTYDEWVSMLRNNYATTIGKEWKCYLLQRRNSVPHHLLMIQISPPLGCLVLPCVLGHVLTPIGQKTKDSVGWHIVLKVRIRFQLQVTALPGFYSLHDWCYQTMRLFTGVSEDPEHDRRMERCGEEAMYCGVKNVMHAIWNEDQVAPQDSVHQIILIDVVDWMIKTSKPWTIRR